MPLVSVIIPNYNHAKFLKQRIDSVLNQTFQDFEVIILDDCSPDNSREIIEQYRNHPKVIHIEYNEVNSGSTFKQWEKGIKLAKGEYIWIAESDDYCENIFLETVLSGFTDDSVVFSYAQSYYINHLSEIKWISHFHKISDLIDGKVFIKDFMVHTNSVFNASMVLFKRSALSSIGNEYLNFKFCGDWMFWVLLANSNEAKVHISGKVLNYFRKHESDVSSKFYKSGNNYIEEIEIMYYIYSHKLIRLERYNYRLQEYYISYRKDSYKFAKKTRKSIRNTFLKYSERSLFMLSFFYFRYKLKSRLKYLINKFL